MHEGASNGSGYKLTCPQLTKQMISVKYTKVCVASICCCLHCSMCDVKRTGWGGGGGGGIYFPSFLLLLFYLIACYTKICVCVHFPDTMKTT